jgi:chromosome segregation ATPase
MNKESFGDNIQVVVRVRPLSEKECKASDKKCVETSSSIPNSIFLDSKPESKKFVYDWVASEADSQKEIYKRIGEPMAEACLQGYNCTIFAYGQTGAGKTYTMQGRGLLESQGLSDECSKGLQPRVLDHIFHRVRAAIQEGTEALVKCSYFEIYNEQIIDLLNPNAGTLVAREDIKKGTFVEGLTEDTVSTCGEAVNVLVKGARNRHVSSTEMNLESSRSHSVFSMTIEQKRNKEGVTNVVTSKINFVDLAGSERQKATNTTGERLKEAGNINKSLTVLGSVINSLVEVSEGKKTHVRYRDSKLTFLLKDSLGGNSKTAIIANISPSTDSFGETLSTLKFAQRAKLIRNNALINEETSGCIDSLKSEIVRLKSLLAAERDSSKMLTEKTEQKPAITFEQECELIKECNTSRHELETLLRESLEILNETDKKLHQEYMKKEEFMALFQKACSMYENKEHHMKLMLKIMRDKTDRVMKGQWDKDSEIESLTRLVDTLRETNENMPSVMKVFQENLHLKHQIVYSNVNGAPSANMLKVMNILRHNMTFMENLHTKLEQGAEQRNRLTKKFGKACLLNGMTAEGLSNINASIENEELKKEKETLGLELLEKKQAEANLKIALEHEQKKLAELNDELQKQRMESQTEVEALEKRIQELNESYNNIQLQGTQISSDYQIREVQLKDQITSLALKRSELVKKLDRVEETLGLLKKTHELEIQTLEKTISQLRLDNMRQQDEITCKKSYNTKLKDENTVLRSEIDSLGSRLKTEVSEKETLTTKVGQMEIELIQLKEKAASNMLEESEASMKLKEKLDEAESEKNQAIQDKQALKEELDTLQQSLDYFKGQLDEKSRVITSLESSKHTLEQNEKTLSATIKTLEEELEKQTQSNSPFNIAIKENHNLRTMLRELRSEMDLAEKKSKRDTESKAHLEKTVESLKESEAYFKAAIKEANLDNQRKSQHLRELSNLLVQNDKEIIELNQAIRNLNDELDSKVADNSSLQETCETLRTDITHLKSRNSFMKNEQAEMKRHLSQKLDEIHAANDRASEAQLRYFTLQQEYDSLKENTERELNLLNNSLKAVNEQNKILMHDKLTKEEEYKKSKSTLITEIASLTTQLKEFKLTMDGIESSENIDQTKVENIRAQIKESIQTGVEELHKVTCENQQLKAELVEKKKNLFILQGKLDTIVKNSTAELLTIKSNSVRLENQYRLAYQSFKLKEEELLKTKEELKFANLEKTGLSHELSQ